MFGGDSCCDHGSSSSHGSSGHVMMSLLIGWQLWLGEPADIGALCNYQWKKQRQHDCVRTEVNLAMFSQSYCLPLESWTVTDFNKLDMY